MKSKTEKIMCVYYEVFALFSCCFLFLFWRFCFVCMFVCKALNPPSPPCGWHRPKHLSLNALVFPSLSRAHTLNHKQHESVVNLGLFSTALCLQREHCMPCGSSISFFVLIFFVFFFVCSHTVFILKYDQSPPPHLQL